MCHTRLGPSLMTEPSKGGLGVCVVQGRKKPTDAEEEREREIDVSEKISEVVMLRTGQLLATQFGLRSSSLTFTWLLQSGQNLRPVHSESESAFRQDPRGFPYTGRFEKY